MRVMRWPRPGLDKGEVLGIMLVVAVMCILAILAFTLVKLPDFDRSHAGFGPEWN
jgi:hypothetical protein